MAATTRMMMMMMHGYAYDDFVEEDEEGEGNDQNPGRLVLI